jgi:cytochrome P450
MLQAIRPYLTASFTAPALVIFFIIYKLVGNAASNNRIRKLGARAPPRVTYMPWGLDMLYQVITYMYKDMNYELWVKMFAEYGKGGHTVEAGTGERVILTVEPENIKAILATQFKDYGKGEQFHKDFHAFLGDGIFTTDGTLWHDSRQLIRPQFIKDRVSDLDIFEEHVQVLLKKVEEAHEINALDIFFR